MRKRKVRRLLYRSGFTDDELNRLIEEIGPGKLWAALTVYTKLPELPTLP